MKTTQTILLTCIAFLLGACTGAQLTKRPAAYSGPLKTVMLKENYVWTAGLAKAHHEFTAGEYVATFEDRNGYYYLHGSNRMGIYVTKDRATVYGFIIATAEDKAVGEQALPREELAVIKAMGAEAHVGDICVQFLVTGEWQRFFAFSD